MPNWCNNSITITGPAEKILDIWSKAQDPDLDKGLLDAMVPMPAELEGTTAPSDGANWYAWRCENWGTKWDIDLEGLELESDENGTATISGWFDSAWSPPIEAYQTFCDEDSDCSIEATYEEGGMDFAGMYKDGEHLGLDGISDIARLKVHSGNSDNPLYDMLDAEMDLTESRRDYIEEEDAEAEEDEDEEFDSVPTGL